MLDRLRRNSKDLVVRRRSSTQTSNVSSTPSSLATLSRTTTGASVTSTTSTARLSTPSEESPQHEVECGSSKIEKQQTSFLDLPAELRNKIYALCAVSTGLTLPPCKQKHPPSPVSLLLASQQIRREYRPVLLSLAPAHFHIQSFEFRNLNRLIGGLYNSELKALRTNRRLTVVFVLSLSGPGSKLTKDVLWNLRRWLNERGHNLDMLPFTYAVGWAEESSSSTALSGTFGGVRAAAAKAAAARREKRLELVDVYLEALSRLYWNLVDTLRFELDAVIGAFEAEQSSLRRQVESEQDVLIQIDRRGRLRK